MEGLTAARLRMVGRWAARLVEGRRVLDASPVIGPATEELARTCREVVAASRIPTGAGQGLVHPVSHEADPSQLPFEPGSFDAVISLDVHSDDARLPEQVREFGRVLRRDGGLLIVSLTDEPCQPDIPQGGDVVRTDVLRDVLRGEFDYVALVGQQITLSSNFVSGLRHESGADLSTVLPYETPSPSSVPAPSDSVHAIAVASDVPLDEHPLSATISSPFPLMQWESKVELLAAEVRQHEARSQQAEHASGDRARLLRELFMAEQTLAHEFDRRAQLDEPIFPSDAAALQRELDAARAQLAEALAHVDALQETVSWRITRPLRIVRGRLG